MYTKYKIIFFLFLTLISNSNIKSQTIKELLEEHYNDTLFDELLGKGGTGEVWGSSNSNIAIKCGESQNQCKKIKKEFKIQKKLHNKITEYNETLLERIIILKPTRIIKNEEENICAMELPRLYPINEERNKNLITQLRLGKKNLDQVEQLDGEIIKGHAIGLEQTKKIVSNYPKINPPKTNIELLFSDIGTLLGILHFKSKLDGLDVELVIVKKNLNDNNYRVALIDFGMCNDLSKYFSANKTNKIIKKVVKALIVEQIFPNPTTKEFSIFMEEYINVAKTEGLEILAKKIIHNFIGQQFTKDKIIKKYLMKKLNINHTSSIQLKKLVPVLYKWTKGSLLFQIVCKNYNVFTKNISNFLKKIIPNIIEQKESLENLSRFEKLLIKKLK